jgi:dephospho-CoA kinase
MKIALIGKAGTGKSTLARLFWEIGWTVIDCDKEVHKAYEYTECKGDIFNYLVVTYGADIIDGRSQKINRKKLAEILASKPRQKELLEDLLYEKVFKPLIKNASKHHTNVLVDGILPRFVTKDFDLVLYAWIDEKERMRRLRNRGVSKNQIKYLNQIQKNWKLTF